MISMHAHSGVQHKFIKLKSHSTSAILVDHIAASSIKVKQLGLWAGTTKTSLSHVLYWEILHFILNDKPYFFVCLFIWSKKCLYIFLHIVGKFWILISLIWFFFLHANVKETLFLFFILIAVYKQTNLSLLWAMKMI